MIITTEHEPEDGPDPKWLAEQYARYFEANREQIAEAMENERQHRAREAMYRELGL